MELKRGGLLALKIVRCGSFFFQAEGGIRDYGVTGVQTCALPIWAAAGGRMHPGYPADGIDLRGAIGGAAPDARKIHFRYKHMEQEAYRDGDWKYLKIRDNSFLFNVVTDPLERANLKDRYPDVFTRMVAAHRAWDATMLPIDPNSFTHGYDGGELADHFKTD